jgi:hypothetical protein
MYADPDHRTLNQQTHNSRVPILLRRRSFAARHYPALAVQTLLDGEGKRVAYIRLHRFDAQVRDGCGCGYAW